MILPVQVTFRNIKEVDTLEALVRKQAAALERYYPDIISCRVMVEVPSHEPSGLFYHVRIDVTVPDEEIVVRREPSIYGALQDVEETRIRKKADLRHPHRAAMRTIREAFKEMRRRIQDYARKRRLQTKRHEPAIAHATVARIFPGEGYGFLLARDGHEVYFHRNSVRSDAFSLLREGAQVGFVEEPGEQGPQATLVRLLRGRSLASDSVPLIPGRKAVAR
ncbi:MAG: HPF/RaiA family ribosome-associated protein [Bryobacterales bacterium]|nr:HPF/RaiA family ribosome-associated protein [Bryobacterales bacterium]